MAAPALEAVLSVQSDAPPPCIQACMECGSLDEVMAWARCVIASVCSRVYTPLVRQLENNGRQNLYELCVIDATETCHVRQYREPVLSYSVRCGKRKRSDTPDEVVVAVVVVPKFI